MAQNKKKCYADNTKRELEFMVFDMVYLNISPMKSVMGFVKTGEPSPQYVGQYEVTKRVRTIAYELKLPIELTMLHPVFHVSMLKKCILYVVSILPFEGLEVDLHFIDEEVSVKILDPHVKKLRIKEVTSVNVLLKNHLLENDNWEV